LNSEFMGISRAGFHLTELTSHYLELAFHHLKLKIIDEAHSKGQDNRKAVDADNPQLSTPDAVQLGRGFLEFLIACCCSWGAVYCLIARGYRLGARLKWRFRTRLLCGCSLLAGTIVFLYQALILITGIRP
jgi:hypothetical protein